MGSITTHKKTGQKRYVYYDKNDTFCSIWLGKVPDMITDSFRCYVDRIVNAQLMNVSLDAETSRWLGELSDKYYEKLAAKGLVPPRKKEAVITLGERIPKLIKALAPSVSGQTVEVWGQAEKSLYMYFGKDRAVNSVRAQSEGYAQTLRAGS